MAEKQIFGSEQLQCTFDDYNESPNYKELLKQYNSLITSLLGEESLKGFENFPNQMAKGAIDKGISSIEIEKNSGTLIAGFNDLKFKGNSINSINRIHRLQEAASGIVS